MKIPKQYLPLMPYLVVKNAKAFKEFVIKVFGATEQYISHREDNLIKHGELRIGDAVIMYGDETGQYKEFPAGMFIYVEDVDKVYKTALDNGAKVLTPPSKQDYGYTAGFEDKWGNQWWIVQGE